LGAECDPLPCDDAISASHSFNDLARLFLTRSRVWKGLFIILSGMLLERAREVTSP